MFVRFMMFVAHKHRHQDRCLRLCLRIALQCFLIAAISIHSLVASCQLSKPFRSFRPGDANTSYSPKLVELPSGVRLEYAERGSASGIPVIFLHGYMDSWQSFNQVLPLLDESIHAYSISQRGHGSSDRPEKGYSPEDLSTDLADFIQKLNIGSAIIVGHSMGATVAQRFALDYPYMIRALVLVSSFASFKTNPGIAELQGIISKMDDPIDSGFVYAVQKSTLFKPIAPSALQTYVNESMKVPARIWKAVAKDALTADYSKDLKELSVPTLIIWGDKDVFCPKSDQNILVTAIKRSRLLVYEGVGHAAQWEDPERFTRDLVDFINGIGGSNFKITEMDLKAAFLSHSFY